MNTKQKGPTPPPASITMRDIYYVLFRHKWLIGILATVGILTSLGVYTLWPFPYYSHAKVFIRYIQDAKPTDMDSSAKVQSPDNRGANIMNTELEILTSADLAMSVVTNLGPTNILGSGNNYTNAAVNFILANLKAEVPKESDVILLEFKANNPVVAQAVLSKLIAAYKDKYVEMHLTPGFNADLLYDQTRESKANLKTANQALEDVKKELGITSLDDAKKYAAELHAKTLDNIYEVQAQLAQNQATISNLLARMSGMQTNGLGTNQSLSAALNAPAPSPDVSAEYKRLTEQLSATVNNEQHLLTMYTTNNVLVQHAQQDRAAAESKVKKYEEENPGLLAVRIGDSSRPGLSAATVDPVEAWHTATDRQQELEARKTQLMIQLGHVVEDAGKLDAAEDTITQAETERKVEDAKYEHLRLAEEQLRINIALGNKVSNIGEAESPTAAGRDIKQILKATLGSLAFFLALAFGLPFFIEMVLDQSLKSPLDVQARIGMPFFVNIPRLNGNGNGNGKPGLLKRASKVPLLAAQNGVTPDAAAGNQTPMLATAKNGQMALWDERHELRPFFETLRDRLMTYFEMINLTHKPKLVAVTSCGAGAGVTTTAAGLASSLSEIGEGNVLLVSMNVRDGEAQHFYKGKLACGIEEVLEKKIGSRPKCRRIFTSPPKSSPMTGCRACCPSASAIWCR
jgi:polysaccharide biosynthesis transport protein